MATEVTTLSIGRDAEPLVVIDGFAPHPDALRVAASAAAFGPAGQHYPGLRAPLPPAYLDEQLPVIAAAVRQAFGRGGALEVIDASFSIVATLPAELTIKQRLPHCDAFGAERIALVHYLSPDDGDGTAFYRHRSTGFEKVDSDRAPIFFGQVDAELRHGNLPPPAYVNGDTPLFERTLAVPARYNRALIYRSWVLHSGAIAPDAVLSPDPQTGRLTVTAFLSIGS